MVTEAGKELLRNTINTAKFHNKILEQNEMWKQWELERGLTMMVSDDDILRKIRKNHQCAKHRKREKSEESYLYKNNDPSKLFTGSSKDVDRWDHSGFKELYPEGVDAEVCSSSSSSKVKSKRGRSGFRELYPHPDEDSERNSSSSSSKVYVKVEKWDHSGYRELYPDKDSSRDSSSSSSEKHSKSKKRKRKTKRKHRSKSPSDKELWEEFKQYKRNKAKKARLEATKSSSSKFDGHVKEWRKRKVKSS